MTSWEGVQDNQCQEFMQQVSRWLLKSCTSSLAVNGDDGVEGFLADA